MPQAMEYLQISRTTLYRLMEQGMLPYYRIAGTRQRRFKRSDLDQLLVLEEPGIPDDDDDAEEDTS
ncbi:MAG: helix-turn-helix domain-containing protein [Caldilineaceae bacterium]